MKNKEKIISCITIIIFVVIAMFNCYKDINNFFRLDFYQMISIFIAIIFTYYYAERRSDERRLNDKIEFICVEIVEELNKTYSILESNNKKRRLMHIKLLQNKINILKELSEQYGKLTKKINYINENFDKYKDLISDNLDQPIGYFIKECRTEKLEKLSINIDNALDEIIVYLYTNKIIKFKL